MNSNCCKTFFFFFQDSKPFSYIHQNGGGNVSRNLSRTSSKETIPHSQSHQGLESPNLLKKIMSNDSSAETNSASAVDGISPKFTTTLTIEQNGSTFSEINNDNGSISAADEALLLRPDSSMSDEEASLSWLERQQRKLQRRREAERRRLNTRPNGAGGTTDILRELKSTVRPTPDPSETLSTRESTPLYQVKVNVQSQQPEQQQAHAYPISSTSISPQPPQPQLRQQQHTSSSSPYGHLQQSSSQQQYASPVTTAATSSAINRAEYQQPAAYNSSPIGLETLYQQQQQRQQHQQQYYTSTPSQHVYSRPLSRQKSDTSYDRNYSRPMVVNRRLRYDSESESDANMMTLNEMRRAYGSNTSIEVISQGGSRPITPAFPQVPGTPYFDQSSGGGRMLPHQQFHHRGNRSVSPGASSLYQHGTTLSTSSRRGSVSSEPAEVSPHHVRLVKENHKFWYKPNISREEAISMLKHRSPGTFVVRDSNSFPGAFGLALKVATPPPNVTSAQSNKSDPEADLVRHFLIEPTSKGVKLKGYSNEPVFASLSALVYQHTLTQLALPIKLVLPQQDLGGGNRDSLDSRYAHVYNTYPSVCLPTHHPIQVISEQPDAAALGAGRRLQRALPLHGRDRHTDRAFRGEEVSDATPVA